MSALYTVPRFARTSLRSDVVRPSIRRQSVRLSIIRPSVVRTLIGANILQVFLSVCTVIGANIRTKPDGVVGTVLYFLA